LLGLPNLLQARTAIRNSTEGTIMFSAILMLAQGGSVLPLLNDRDLCRIMTRNVAAYAGQTLGVVVVETARANCPARRIEVSFRMAATERNPAGYMDAFMNQARGGVCGTDPTMRAFNDRGWKFEYTFILPDESKDVRTLTC
jgi:hypothetical protein